MFTEKGTFESLDYVLWDAVLRHNHTFINFTFDMNANGEVKDPHFFGKNIFVEFIILKKLIELFAPSLENPTDAIVLSMYKTDENSVDTMNTTVTLNDKDMLILKKLVKLCVLYF